MTRFKRLFLFAGLMLIALVAKGYWNATRDPIVRRAAVTVADWPKGFPPVKVLLLSDIHVAGPDMPPERVARIVGQLNQLKPDLVLIAGDLMSDKKLATHVYTPDEAVAPLKGFRAPLGTVITLGNHDHWIDEAGISAAIRKYGLTLLDNQAVRRGPLVVGGIDDDFSHHANIAATFAAMDRLAGPRILLTHSPDVVADLPSSAAAVFAGHTHCGQIRRPFSDRPLYFVTRHEMRFQCGDIHDPKARTFVTAGLGTSGSWIRFRAPPDVWLVTLGP